MTTCIRVLVVDDSTFIRNAITGMLKKSPEIKVIGQARNGEEAIKKVAELSPDVMTLDIDMPGMNGLEVLKSVMKHSPLPVIMVSSLTEDSAKETIHALELGAMDFISKQLNGSIFDISKIEKLLVDKVKAAALSGGKITGLADEKVRLEKKKSASHPYQPEVAHSKSISGNDCERCTAVDSLVIIGSSTGGPKVIQQMLEEFPSTLSSAVIIVQHMPKYFTKPFADRLNQLCPLVVCEAKDGDLLEAGKVFVAPGSRHLRLEATRARQVAIRVSPDPAHLPYRPSVDLAMESAAKIFGSSLIGVVLTGMGNDGEVGMHAIKQAGGCTLVQNEETCMVYGMPKAVIDAGYADAVLPISWMSSEVLNRIQKMTVPGSGLPLEVHT